MRLRDPLPSSCPKVRKYRALVADLKPRTVAYEDALQKLQGFVHAQLRRELRAIRKAKRASKKGRVAA